MQCPFMTRSEGWTQKHVRTHQLTPRRHGRPRKTAATIILTQPQAGSDLWEKVNYQRFFPSGPQSRFFRVTPLLKPTVADVVDTIGAQIYEQIWQCERKEKEYNQVITTDRDYSEYSHLLRSRAFGSVSPEGPTGEDCLQVHGTFQGGREFPEKGPIKAISSGR